MAEAIFAGGSFWCTEAVFRSIAGDSAVESGYIGGTVPHPTYKQVCTGETGHAEAIRITFDPAIVSFADLLDIHMATHDPTQLNRQGNDIGTQYRTALFPLDEAQHAECAAGIARWNAAHPGQQAVTTIEGFADGAQRAEWHPAEDYHQEYWQGEGQRNSYCLAVIPPKLAKLQKGFADKLKA